MSTRAPTPTTGVHDAFIRQQTPPWLLGTTPQRIAAFKALKPPIPVVYAAPTQPAALPALKHAIGQHWERQNAVDHKLQALNDLQGFAEPLLKNALANYGDIDVRNTYIRLYSSADLPWWTINVIPGEKSQTRTLLEAALHNFSLGETFTDYAFLSGEDVRGQRTPLTFNHATTGEVLSAEIFKTLCRDLDLGARYQRELHAALGLSAPTVEASLRHKVIASLKAGLDSAAHLALAQQDIGEDDYALIQAMLTGRPGPLTLGGQAIEFYTLDLLDTRLPGILIIATQTADWGTGRMLAYVPNDPHHPLKHYPSSLDFVQELTRQLRDEPPAPGESPVRYQQFFSQFVAQQQRGAFFAELNSLLATVRWHPRDPTDNRPNWRAQPVETPNLRLKVAPVREDSANRSSDPGQHDLWHYLYRVKHNKVLNDAQEIAVSTAYADRMARWAWWDNLGKIVSDLLNAALLVITPFVPGVGELMLAYTAYQLADEVFEGVIDWAEGQGLEALEHVFAVVQNVIELATFGAAGKVGEVARLKLSPFVEGLKPVQTPSGHTRLWHPDLSPYQHPALDLSPRARADENGLHRHNGKQLLRHDGQHYEVRQDPVSGQHHLQHPRRPDAYRPRVRLNGNGTVVHELEQPRTWSNRQLLRRLGPMTDGLSDAELEDARRISGVDHGHLRRLYTDNQPTPPLLADTLQQRTSEHYASASVQRIRSAQPLDPAALWFEQTITELPGWPREKGLQVFERSDLSGASRTYGNREASGNDLVRISLADVLDGRLPEQVLATLDDAHANQLLGYIETPAQRPQALRNLLADYVASKSTEVARDHYLRHQASSDPKVELLREQYPELPLSIAEQLVRHTRPGQRQTLSDAKRLPLDVSNRARELAFEATSTRAFAPIYREQPLSPTSENLALNTLRLYSDALANVRLEVREAHVTGALRVRVGAEDAPHARVLIRGTDGRYRVRGDTAQPLSEPTDFYSAVLLALSADASKTPLFALNEGELFRQWLVRKTQPPTHRRLALAQPPIRTEAERETLVLLTGGNSFSRLGGAQAPNPQLTATRIKRLLPEMSEQGVERFSEVVEGAEGGQLLERIEGEKNTLSTQLDSFVRGPTRWPAKSRLEAVERQARALFADKLLECWQDGYTQQYDEYRSLRTPTVLDLSELPWPERMPELTQDFHHVTQLYLFGSGFSDEHASFLLHFPSLRRLDLSDNVLTAVPPAVGKMRALTHLDLSNNRLILDPASHEHLRGRHRLRELALSNNPLGTAPDISQMPSLTGLLLSHTQISEWPGGLFAQPRGEDFILQMPGNPITHLPQVPPASDEALTIALARVDYRTLTADYQDLYEHYREAHGLDPHRHYDPKGESGPWLEGLDDAQQHAFKATWYALEHEHGSQGFFEVISSLEDPEFFESEEDQTLYARDLGILRRQVWRMFQAMEADGELRQRVFRQTSFPGLCADAGMQIFNGLGIEVEASQARLFSRTASEREERLVTLARGAARLKLLANVARADIAHRLKPLELGGLGLRLNTQMIDSLPGTVDEVEVHLAYQTRLARRLDLPWVSEHMVYRSTAGVSDAAIDQAYNAVQALSEGDGLVNQMLLEPYWERFLKEQYAPEYDANEQSIDEQFDALDELYSEQQALAQDVDLSEEQRAIWHTALQARARELGLDATQWLPDPSMSEVQYNQALNDLGERRQQWLRDQTRLLLDRLDQ
ncbi:Leucine rich repeat-containing protein [Pseudomonas sp. ok272]|uniref:NEL-type E3 ubiquitin ligase domain-containing protein n=1 Tax=unclassified Pseudomonas TaxID=196821 RepID=UPI0008CAD29A|nr:MULTISPECIES: NEL-type E3 ubiquitin ligase domain-containing protein [unclassified Pseudomonas]SEN14630.1 Leucine rich repeat-containing protein [Pseudomonas sp. ok272]SFN07073.1 Leucine rich repeat-containing protein [Pseudomonas sp. ok602]